MSEKGACEEQGGKVVPTQSSDSNCNRTEDHLKLFKKVVEHATDAIGISTPEGRHWYRNAAFDAIFGDIGEDPPATLYCDENVGREVFETIVAGDEWSGEVQMYAADGRVLYILLRAYAFTDETGLILGLVGVHTDITERKQAEIELLREKHFSETLINQLPGSFYMFAKNDRMLQWNDNLEKVTGYSAEEIQQMNALDFFDADEKDRVHSRIKEVFVSGVSQVEANFLTKDGRKIPHVLTGSRVEYDGMTYLLGVGQDITESKQVETAYRESESRFRQIAEHIREVFWLFDWQEQRVLYVSPAYDQIWGRSHESLYERYDNWTENIHPDDMKQAQESFNRILDTGGGEPREYRIVRPDGSERWISDTGYAVKDGDGKIVRITGIAEDVTERKRVEEALNESEVRYRTLFESAGDAIFLLNKEIFLDCNKKALEVFGCSRDEIIGRSPVKFSPPVQPDGRDSPEKAAEKISAAMNGNPLIFEWKHKKLNGTLFDAEVSLNLVELSTSSFIQAIVRDVSERKNSEEALLKEKEFTELALDAQMDTFFLFELSTNKAIRWNKSFRDFVGYTDEEIASLPAPASYYSPDDLERAIPFIEKIMVEGSGTIELELISKNGQRIPTEYRVAVIYDEGGKPAHLISIGRDITERKRAEEEKRQLEAQLQRAEKMEAIGTLAGGVAHDLNNVLCGLVSYPDLMLMDLPDDSPLISPIMTIKNSGKKAAAIVQDLLTLARRGVAVTEVNNLNYIINDYMQSSEYKKLRTHYPNIQIECSLASDLLPILASSIHLSNTIMNLVSNAAEAISGEGLVTLSTTNRYIDKPIKSYDGIKEGDYAVLTVADNGVGISSEGLGKIFEPFYTKKKMGRSGTGLGLAVVWGTVKDHNGYIDIESIEGEGTVFKLYFPVTREKVEKERVTTTVEELMGHGEKILVVDDVKEQREIATKLLTKLNYRVHVVSSGEEAIEYVKQSAADLLILDMIMDPGIDGLDAYKKILELHPGQKAIIASGYSETERVKEAKKFGAGQYLKKPYTLKKIGLAVKAELSRQPFNGAG